MTIYPKPELFDQLCDWSNLLLAFGKAAKGKRGREPAAAFEYRLEDNLIALQRELRQKTYRPGAYDSFYIHDPKKRLISAAPFRDRVVHHALCNVIEPIFEKRFIHDSYANRKGKGTHRAIARAQRFLRRFAYVLPCDIRQFFPSIDHAVLTNILERHIKDADVMWLVDRIVQSGRGVLNDVYDMVYFPGDDLFAVNRPRGLPIGNLTSQFWANCYLDGFDHFVKRELHCKGYVRYVDDMLFFSDSKNRLWQVRQAVIERLGRLRLTIHFQKSHPRPTRQGVPFLGFVVYPHKRRLKPRRGIAYCRKLRSQVAAYHDGELAADKLAASFAGWCNYAGQGDTDGLIRDVTNRYLMQGKGHRHDGCNTAVYQNV
jgi:retron-type reverse transcriptase